jgi:hypothetical protein
VAQRSAILFLAALGDAARMSGQRSLRHEGSFARAKLGVLPDDLYVQGEPWPRAGRPFRHDPSKWTVTDDWPEHVPVNPAEIAVFEAWFADLFDELLGQRE